MRLPVDLRLKFLETMLRSRESDRAEQALKREGAVDFQLSSEGHEALAALAFAMRPEDYLHPHYRDRAIVLGRGFSLEEIFLDFFAKAAGPSKGRQMPVHYNSRERRIVSISTPVSTQMLQAAGMAMSLKERNVAEVVVTTIGDAATREGEFYEAVAVAVTDNLPVVFVIEDNGYGISTPTEGRTFWTMKSSLARDASGAEYFHGCPLKKTSGLDPDLVYAEALRAIENARAGGGPAILVCRVERLKSHSSSDDQTAYRSKEELDAISARDPVTTYTARCLADQILTQTELDALTNRIRGEVSSALEKARCSPEPDIRQEDDALFPSWPADLSVEEVLLPAPLAKEKGGKTMAQCIDIVLEQEIERGGRVFIYGEDIEDPKGDVFGVTRNLSRKFPGHVRNSPLAEATIVGVAAGRALLGDTAVAAIQFVDFMGPGMNQLMNEVTTFYWRSGGQWNCPVVLMAPCGGYLPGVGPWHSQTNEAVFAHLPGLCVAIPSTPGDAAGLLRTALRCRRPVLFLYPKRLLHGASGTVESPNVNCLVPFGKARFVRRGDDVTIVSWGNVVGIAEAAAGKAAEKGVSAEIIDLRTITPWDQSAVIESVRKTGRLIVAHEDAKTSGFGAEVIAEVASAGVLVRPPIRIAKPDTFNPYNVQLELGLLPKEQDIFEALLSLGRSQSPQPAPEPEIMRPTANAEQKSVIIVVPRQSPTDEDARLAAFLVRVGDAVRAGQVLAELESNKGTFELTSPCEGRVKTFFAEAGATVLVGTNLIEIETTTDGTSQPAQVDSPKSVPHTKRIVLSPAQLQVGRLAAQSLHEIPQSSVEMEIDLTNLELTIGPWLTRFEETNGFRPGRTSLFLWAVTKSIMQEEHARFRGHLSHDNRELIVPETVNIAFAAVGPGEDLYTPVIQHAEVLSFADMARQVHDLTDAVRQGTIRAEDLQGASLTLSNIGRYGVAIGTPFVIPGQTAILACGTIQRRPGIDGDDGRMVPSVRYVVHMRLAFDHRPVNGSHAARFLHEISVNLESLRVEELVGHS